MRYKKCLEIDKKNCQKIKVFYGFGEKLDFPLFLTSKIHITPARDPNQLFAIFSSHVSGDVFWLSLLTILSGVPFWLSFLVILPGYLFWQSFLAILSGSPFWLFFLAILSGYSF